MEHTHDVDIPDHEHIAIAGINEDTFPTNVKVRLNGQQVGDTIPGWGCIQRRNQSYTIYQWPGDYELIIESGQNGRIVVAVTTVLFIQSR